MNHDEEAGGTFLDDQAWAQPRKLQRLLSLFECETIPEELFERAIGVRHTWGPLGDLTTGVSLVPKWLHLLLEEEYSQNKLKTHSTTFRATLGAALWEKRFAMGSLSSEYSSSKEVETTLFDILSTVMHSFPEPYAEILWQENTASLWPVVRSTCLPFLTVIDLSDLQSYVGLRSRADRLVDSIFLIAFARFLHRIIVYLRFNNPLNLLHLSKQTIDCLLEGVKAKTGTRSHREILRLKEMDDFLCKFSAMKIDYDLIQSYLLPGKSNTGIFNDNLNYTWLQLTFGIGFPQLMGRLLSENAPAFMGNCGKMTKWSSMDVLANTNAVGARTVKTATGSVWTSQPVMVRILVAFRAICDKDFSMALQILEADFEEVKESQGVGSTSFVVVGTQLALCYNALGMEIKTELLAEEIINAVWPLRTPGSIRPNDTARLRFMPDVYLFMAYSDSLICRGLYDRVRPILVQLRSFHIQSNETALLCVLRILKISRRQQAQDSTSENWTLLQDAISLLDKVSGGALYQYFEEAMCMLSSVHNKDTVAISRAKSIVDALDTLDIDRFQGSDAMKLTLQEYQQELKVYRRDLGLFSVIGPQLHYCRTIREGYPKASITLIERIGAANWERFQRLNQPHQTEKAVVTVATAEPSRFHDSGIGSSLQPSTLPTLIQAPLSKAKSRLSMNTAPGPGLSGLLEVPTELLRGLPYPCEWCGISVKMENPKYQWPRHVFEDLRPYVCVMEDCDVLTPFGSQADFEQHLATHAFINTIICPICNHSEPDTHHYKQHFRLAHPYNIMPAAVHSKKVPRNLDTEICPFCLETPGSRSFVRHVSRHCEEVALSSLSQSFDEDSGEEEEDYDDNDNAVKNSEIAASHALEEPIRMKHNDSLEAHDGGKSTEDFSSVASVSVNDFGAILGIRPSLPARNYYDESDSFTMPRPRVEIFNQMMRFEADEPPSSDSSIVDYFKPSSSKKKSKK